MVEEVGVMVLVVRVGCGEGWRSLRCTLWDLVGRTVEVEQEEAGGGG